MPINPLSVLPPLQPSRGLGSGGPFGRVGQAALGIAGGYLQAKQAQEAKEKEDEERRWKYAETALKFMVPAIPALEADPSVNNITQFIQTQAKSLPQALGKSILIGLKDALEDAKAGKPPDVILAKIQRWKKGVHKLANVKPDEPKEWKPTTKEEAFAYKAAGRSPDYPYASAGGGIIFNKATGVFEDASPEDKADWGATEKGRDDKGKPVFFTRSKSNPDKIKIIKGVTPEPKSGMTVYDRDGNPILTTGEGGQEITKGFKTDIEKRVEKLNNNYSQMSYIKSKLYDPKFTTLRTRWDALKTTWKAKTGWGTIAPEDKKLAGELSKWRRRTTLLFNEFVKLMSGVAVREEEMPRYKASIPTSGVGVFDGDDFITFESKMDDFMVDAERAIARLNYVRKKGLSSIQEVELDDVDQIIRDRMTEIKTKNPSISDVDLRNQLGKEFGIMF